MRPLTHPRRPVDQKHGEPDEGAVLIWVALMIVVLLGVGAIVIDVGALYVERRQLQNGADAASLAVAQDCAEGDCGSGGGSAIANQYADLNANDGASAIEPSTPCGVGPGLSGCAEPAPSGAEGATGWVRVNTSTETPSGGTEVSFLLAPLVSAVTGLTVHASAVAAWGPPESATAFPFIVSECEFMRSVPPNTSPDSPSTIVIWSKVGSPGNQDPLFPDDPDLPSCIPRSSPGGTVEGGFGWLNVTGDTCTVKITVGEPVQGDPGNDNLLKKVPCKQSSSVPQEVVLPMFNKISGTGNSAFYTVAGFVGFTITNYQLSGSATPDFECPPPPWSAGQGNNLRCIEGTFNGVIIGDGEIGGGYDFGARVIEIVG